MTIRAKATSPFKSPLGNPYSTQLAEIHVPIVPSVQYGVKGLPTDAIFVLYGLAHLWESICLVLSYQIPASSCQLVIVIANKNVSHVFGIEQSLVIHLPQLHHVDVEDV